MQLASLHTIQTYLRVGQLNAPCARLADYTSLADVIPLVQCIHVRIYLDMHFKDKSRRPGLVLARDRFSHGIPTSSTNKPGNYSIKIFVKSCSDRKRFPMEHKTTIYNTITKTICHQQNFVLLLLKREIKLHMVQVEKNSIINLNKNDPFFCH